LFAGHLLFDHTTKLQEREIQFNGKASLPIQLIQRPVMYAALGHLHQAQSIDSNQQYNYSGSPICMGFDEPNESKRVNIVNLDGKIMNTKQIEVPVFRKFVRLSGSMEEILLSLSSLPVSDRLLETLVNININDAEDVGMLQPYDKLLQIASEKKLRILRGVAQESGNDRFMHAELELLQPEEVLKQYLVHQNIPEKKILQFMNVFNQINREINQ
jgi:exonuclease SbcD